VPGCTTSFTQYAFGHYDQILAVSPVNTSTLYFGGVAPYISINSGVTWTALAAQGGTHPDQHAAQFAPCTGSPCATNTVYTGTDGGLFVATVSPTISFRAANATLAAGQIQGLGTNWSSPSTVLAGFQDNGTQMYTTSASWPAVEGGDGGFTLFDHLPDPNKNTVYWAYHTFQSGNGSCGGNYPYLSMSEDGGSTWNSLTPTANICTTMKGANDTSAIFYPPFAVDPFNAHRILFGAHSVYSSTDGMQSWTQQTTSSMTGTGCGNSSLCALEDIEIAPSVFQGEVWALSAWTNIAGTNVPAQISYGPSNLDSGATWMLANGNLNLTNVQPTSIAISPFYNSQNMTGTEYVTFAGFRANTQVGHIYVTTNHGTTWAETDGNLPDIPVLKLLIDKSDPTGMSLLAGTDSGLFESLDGGATWTKVSAIPNVPVFDITQNDQYEIVVGTHGRGAYRLAPPVILRSVATEAEQYEAGFGYVKVFYPSNIVPGDRLIAMVLYPGCYTGSGSIYPPSGSGWNQIGTTVSYATSACSDLNAYGITGWVFEREITPQLPVPASGYQKFEVAGDFYLYESESVTAAFSGASASSIDDVPEPYVGSSGTAFTAPQITFSSHDGIALQWFFDNAFMKSPGGLSPENYEDKYGPWVGFQPSDPAMILDFPTDFNDFNSLWQVLLPSSGTYGPWTGTAVDLPMSGDPTPPPATGDGWGWTIVIPPNG